MTDIRRPRLLDANLREIDRPLPLKLRLELQLQGLSTAVMTLAPGAPEVSVRDLAELYDENGSAGIFRVTDVEGDVGGVRTIRLEHGLCTLRDSMMPAQAFMKPVRQALQTVLDCQDRTRWALGDVEVPQDMTLIFSTDYADGLTALETMLAMLPEGYGLEFDQSGEPWVLHLRRLPEEIGCEGRLTRNLRSVRITQSDARLCTRVYPFGAETDTGRVSLMPIEGLPYTEDDADGGYGVVSRTFTSDRIFDSATLLEVATLYLSRHGSPETTITVDACDLSAATEDDFDRFRLGRRCRLALPAQGLVVTARICTICKEDVYGEPGRAVLTLSDRLPHSRESAEIDELIRQVTAGKLLGGTVAEVVHENRAEGTYQSPIEHSFQVEDWPDLLDVRAEFVPDRGVSVTALRVDDMHPPQSVWRGGSFSLMPYLRRDELGRIARGEHELAMHPYSASGTGAVSSKVTLTVIQG